MAQLCGQYTKFSNSLDREAFTFSQTVLGMVVGEGELFEEVDVLYLPFNFDKIHWVALAVHLHLDKILVLDCNLSALPDSIIKQKLEPLAVMLPYVFNKTRVPLSIERVSGLPQISNPAFSGVMSVLFMQAHGEHKCPMVDAEQLPNELKKLVTRLIKNLPCQG